MNSKNKKIAIPAYSNKREIAFSGELKEYIFHDHMLSLPFPRSWGEPDIKKYFDEYNDYTLNSYLYRGPEFFSDVDIITAGCSFTFGIGVPDNGTWPELFSGITGSSYINLSAPGAGVEWIVDSIYKYIHTFGAPKKGIVVLFPDIFRVNVLVDDRINTTMDSYNVDFVPYYRDDARNLTMISYSPSGVDSPKVLKRPYPIEYTTSFEQCVKTNVMKIKDLERYCKAANIPLVWSSWSDSVFWLYNSNSGNTFFKNYLELEGLANWKSHSVELEITEDDPEGIVDYKLDHNGDRSYELYGCTQDVGESDICMCYSMCHFDLIEQFPDSFHMATDRWKHGKDHCHVGVHRLIHVAEDFANYIKENW